MELQPTIALGGIRLQLAASSRSIDIHGERRATDSSLHAFFFVGELDPDRSPRPLRQRNSTGSAVPITWYYSPLADFEKKRLRVEESVVAAAVTAALQLCAASNTKVSTMVSSPKMPQVYVRVGKTSTFRKYEYVTPSPTEQGLASPAGLSVDTTPPRLTCSEPAGTVTPLNFSCSPSRSPCSPGPSPAPPLGECPLATSSSLELSPPLGEKGAETHMKSCVPVELGYNTSLENGLGSHASDRPYAEAGLMELPQHPPRQSRLNPSAPGSRLITPLNERIGSVTNGRPSRRSGSFKQRLYTESDGSARTVDTPTSTRDTTAFPAKAITLSPGGSSTPFLSCSMGRISSFQLSTSATTLGDTSGSTTNGWIVNVDEGLMDNADQSVASTGSSLYRPQHSQSSSQTRVPHLPSPRREGAAVDRDAPQTAKVLHVPTVPSQRRQPRRPGQPRAVKAEESDQLRLTCTEK